MVVDAGVVEFLVVAWLRWRSSTGGDAAHAAGGREQRFGLHRVAAGLRIVVAETGSPLNRRRQRRAVPARPACEASTVYDPGLRLNVLVRAQSGVVPVLERHLLFAAAGRSSGVTAYSAGVQRRWSSPRRGRSARTAAAASSTASRRSSSSGSPLRSLYSFSFQLLSLRALVGERRDDVRRVERHVALARLSDQRRGGRRAAAAVCADARRRSAVRFRDDASRCGVADVAGLRRRLGEERLVRVQHQKRHEECDENATFQFSSLEAPGRDRRRRMDDTVKGA